MLFALITNHRFSDNTINPAEKAGEGLSMPLSGAQCL